MVNRFLTGATTQGVSEEELQDGSLDINVNTLKASNLQPNKNVITNGDGVLITVPNSEINPFDQTLNTTDSVIFNSVNINNGTITSSVVKTLNEYVDNEFVPKKPLTDRIDPIDNQTQLNNSNIIVLQDKTQKINYDGTRTEIKGDIILRNDDGIDDETRAIISGNTDELTISCDVLDLSNNLRVADSLNLVRSVIDAENPIDINGNNTSINYKIINTRAGSRDKDIFRYDQVSNTFLFSDSLTTVENTISNISNTGDEIQPITTIDGILEVNDNVNMTSLKVDNIQPRTADNLRLEATRLDLKTSNFKIIAEDSFINYDFQDDEATFRAEVIAETGLHIGNKLTGYTFPTEIGEEGQILKLQNDDLVFADETPQEEFVLNNINVDEDKQTDINGQLLVGEESFRNNLETLFQQGVRTSRSFNTDFNNTQRGFFRLKYENLNLTPSANEIIQFIVFQADELSNLVDADSYRLQIRKDINSGNTIFTIVDGETPVQQVEVLDINNTAGTIELRKEAVDVLTVLLDGNVVMTQVLNVRFAPGLNYGVGLVLTNATTSSFNVLEVRGFTPRFEVEEDDIIINSNVQFTGNRSLLLGGNSGQSEDQACVLITLIAGETIRQGRVVKIVNIGGLARVQTVKGGDPDNTIVIGVAAETKLAGQPVKVCVGGAPSCTVQTGTTINPGDFLEKSDSLLASEQGRVVTFGPGGSIAGMFAVSISPTTTGNIDGTERVRALFIRNEIA